MGKGLEWLHPIISDYFEGNRLDERFALYVLLKDETAG